MEKGGRSKKTRCNYERQIKRSQIRLKRERGREMREKWREGGGEGSREEEREGGRAGGRERKRERGGRQQLNKRNMA